MPNWCKGDLKVRGTIENLKKFVLEGLHPVNFWGQLLKDELKEDDGCISSKVDCWIEGTRRGFVEDLDIDLVYLEDYEQPILVLHTKFAWAIDPEQLLNICKKFNVDMKIYAFERGQEFNQRVEIVDGKIVHDEEITFDNYRWECPCPELGG